MNVHFFDFFVFGLLMRFFGATPAFAGFFFVAFFFVAFFFAPLLTTIESGLISTVYLFKVTRLNAAFSMRGHAS